MATLSSERLLQFLLASLPGARSLPSQTAPKPALLDVPDIGRVRIYLWTTTPDESEQGRPEGEHKSQIIIPGSARGSRQRLDLDATPTFVMGYSPLYGVFTIWEAVRHQGASYSKNIQVSSLLLEAASRDGWAIDAPRRTQLGPEVRAAIHPSHLARFLLLSVRADERGLSGPDRQTFLLSGAPDLDALGLSARIVAGEPIELGDVERARLEARVTRLKRDAGFSKRVLEQFTHQCAICQIQLSMLEAAHIIPVHHPKGSDEIWNGLALCPNHHTLFDRRILLIDERAIVRADDETLDILKDLGRSGGYEETIGRYRDRTLQSPPRFFRDDRALQQKMLKALEFTFYLR